MKKLIALFTSLFLLLGLNTIVSADTTVTLESGKDDGYIKNDGDTYTAIPYDGNEFIGWFESSDDNPYSTDATTKLPAGNFIAKFKSNNVVTQNGYELSEVGTSYLDDSWAHAGTKDSWVTITISEDYANSGKKSLKLNARQQKDIYLALNGLKANTDYVVSYKWLLPKTAITATPTMNDGYFGSAIGTTSTTKITSCFAAGDYSKTANQTFVGGQWNKTKYIFNTKNNTDLRLFLSYTSDMNTGNDALYLDEFMVYEAIYESDNSGFSKYSINVLGENSYAYSSAKGFVEADSEITVTAAPKAGYKFDGWYEKGNKVSDKQMYTFTATANRSLTAKSVLITGTEAPIVPDVNLDDAINLDDVVSLAQNVAGWKTEVNSAVLDVDGNGAKDLEDVVLLAQYVAGWDVKDKLAKTISSADALPEEDINSPQVREMLLAGQSEYFNKSTKVSNGNQALLAKVIKKAQNGEDITVVGIGGSITQGAGASNAANRYGERVAAWLQKQFPNITVKYINAGIGSTTSLVGVHRLDTDVFAHNPDLVMVDFTVNDGASDERYKLSYETIIRTILKKEIAVISLVFGAVADPLNPKFAENGLCSHLPTMVYYDVPVIDYYSALWKYIDAGIVNWNDDLTADGLHPNDNGHLMIASAIQHYLNSIIKNVNNISTTIPALPDNYLFGSNIYETATFLNSNNFTPTANENFVSANVHSSKLAKGWICSNETGGSITFEVKNVTSISIFLQNKLNVNGKGDIIVNGKTVVSGTDCSGGSSSGYVWISYNEMFNSPTDLTITIKAYGKFGVGPLGVTY